MNGLSGLDREKRESEMEKIKKSDEEWKKELTPEQYNVCRQKGTERAFTGQYWDSHERGVYRCACSGDPAGFRELATRFLQMPLGEVERIEPAALRAA